MYRNVIQHPMADTEARQAEFVVCKNNREPPFGSCLNHDYFGKHKRNYHTGELPRCWTYLVWSGAVRSYLTVQ